LRTSAEAAFDRSIPLGVEGPSNVGNSLASVGVPATYGLGVTYRNVHASDECIEVSTIEPVHPTHRAAALRLVAGDPLRDVPSL
jgi:succinyl-diaminopimelate desuccinylase